MADIQLVDMPIVPIGGKEFPCSGCYFERQGDSTGRKSRKCIAEAEHYTKCRISSDERKIWKRKAEILADSE